MSSTQNEKYVDIKYLLEHTPWCRATIYNRIKAGKFPAQKKSGYSSYWVLSEVEHCLTTGEMPSTHQDGQPTSA